MTASELVTASELIAALSEARQTTLGLIADLSDEQLMGPRLAVVNPLLWEIGHVAWFQEHWALRHLRGLAPDLGEGDALYDSSTVAHETRWDLPLPARKETLAYLARVLERVADLLDREPNRDSWSGPFFLRVLGRHYAPQPLSIRPHLSGVVDGMYADRTEVSGKTVSGPSQRTPTAHWS